MVEKFSTGLHRIKASLVQREVAFAKQMTEGL